MVTTTKDVPVVLGGKNASTKNKTWQFAVVGTDDKGPRYLGFTDTHEEAVKLQGNMTTVGWQRVAVSDATLTVITDEPLTAAQRVGRTGSAKMLDEELRKK